MQPDQSTIELERLREIIGLCQSYASNTGGDMGATARLRRIFEICRQRPPTPADVEVQLRATGLPPNWQHEMLIYVAPLLAKLAPHAPAELQAETAAWLLDVAKADREASEA